MNLKFQQFQKLNKREKNLAIVVALLLVAAVYWYGFISPNLRQIKELNEQITTLQTQVLDLQNKTNTDAVKQQINSLNSLKTELNAKIAGLKNEKYITSKTVISDELATLGHVKTYELIEVERTSTAIKYNLHIEHNSDYETVIKHIKRLEQKYPQLFFTSTAMKNNVYTSEWNLWLKQ